MTDHSHPSAASRQTPNGEAGRLSKIDTLELVRKYRDAAIWYNTHRTPDRQNHWREQMNALWDELTSRLATRSADAVPTPSEAGGREGDAQLVHTAINALRFHTSCPAEDDAHMRQSLDLATALEGVRDRLRASRPSSGEDSARYREAVEKLPGVIHHEHLVSRRDVLALFAARAAEGSDNA